MSDFIYSKITFHGESMEIMTPKNVDDAQHRHTLAYFAGFNELREREAKRVESINSYAAEQLRKPWKIYSRENPGGLTTGSSYMGDKRNWHPALPVVWWSPPKPLKGKSLANKVDSIMKKVAAGEYKPRAIYPNHDQDLAFTDVTFEEI